MTAATTTQPGLASQLVNGILAIKPLANFAKSRARKMMVDRAEKIGVPWRDEVKALLSYDLEAYKTEVENPQLSYPSYYGSFHAYDAGNLCWEAATEVEVAARAVHAMIWPEAGAKGDAQLRHSYHKILQAQLPTPPQNIVDLGCSVGMSTFALKEIYPHANLTGVDLSPYFLAVAHLRSQQRQEKVQWVHTPAENTGLPSASYDLVSTFLMFHELPLSAAQQIFQEACRLVRPGGYFALMDMNPKSEVFAKMPAYVLTLLKSTEPYLDEYFALDIEQALVEAGFEKPTITCNSPRHRTVIAKKSE